VSKRRAPDEMDEIAAAWAAARPDLDASHLAVLGRLSRIDALVRRRVEAWLAPFGLSWDMFDLLATLLRAPGHAMRPGELSRWCLLSSGAMTKRIDRVVAAGFARREADPADRRAQLIRLTPAGRRLAERAVPAHFAAARGLLAPLGAAEQASLARLAARLLAVLEPPAMSGASPTDEAKPSDRRRAVG
jgi:DNA-binding MarR family transcriptional regulator